jgi:hypothetical protein
MVGSAAPSCRVNIRSALNSFAPLRPSSWHGLGPFEVATSLDIASLRGRLRKTDHYLEDMVSERRACSMRAPVLNGSHHVRQPDPATMKGEVIGWDVFPAFRSPSSQTDRPTEGVGIGQR